MLRIALRYTRFESNAHGQGPADMLVNPEGWDGNFFNSWTRAANQFEAYPTFQFAPKKSFGRHELKIGADVTHRSYGGKNVAPSVPLFRPRRNLAAGLTFPSHRPTNPSPPHVETFTHNPRTFTHP